MTNSTKGRHKLAARGFVIIGTVLAGVAIWTSIANTVPSSAQDSSALPGTSSNTSQGTTNNSGSVTSPAQPAVPKSTAPKRQAVVPRLRTRSS